jgi:sulfoxide reductase heme-binding subunit YedZ
MTPLPFARIEDRTLRLVKGAVFVLALGPLARLVLGIPFDWLGVNPIELITRSTGTWTLVFILVTLGVTPLRRLTGWNWLIRLRRMLGLFAFFYGVLHFLTYIWLDQFFDVQAIVKDIVKRPFVTVGFGAFLLMLPLALTSTNAMVRRLGGKRWVALHRAVYAVAVLGVVHYWWLVKRDLTQPIIYASVLALLLGFRLAWRAREQRRVPAKSAACASPPVKATDARP